MKKKIGISSIDMNLIEDLGTCEEYLDEMFENTIKLRRLLVKEESELTDEDKQLLKRSSELVVLIELTEALEKMKKR